MSLSRCGRVYSTFDAAYKAAEQRTFKTGRKHLASGCTICADWHVIDSSVALAVQLDPFPPVVARQLDQRDEYCQRCGRGPARLERHHRRAKCMGGSKARAHTQCACNGLKLCRQCHAWVHDHPAESRDHGWIVRQGVALPAMCGVTRCIGVSDQGQPVLDPQWATCDGRWVHSPQEAEG